MAYAEVLAAILASSISRVQREADLEDLAFHDPLTSLFNRRGLDDRAAEVFTVPDGEVRTVTIVAVDIDGLKNVNDTKGHASGDQQILAVAAALTATFDLLGPNAVARVGGDEFTVIVADRPMELVVGAIDDVCRQVSSAPLAVSVSAGVASAQLTRDSPVKSSELLRCRRPCAVCCQAVTLAVRGGLGRVPDLTDRPRTTARRSCRPSCWRRCR
ncbi:GGDEF domain-containing protein [Aeromicrobium sp. UC242_57]|uniref:GGDEF domain-containing protein n=1 Tax=Aeromicrobium sp. UC242_57 TaxID=3374624 RepID=UPI0037B8FF8D